MSDDVAALKAELATVSSEGAVLDEDIRLLERELKANADRRAKVATLENDVKELERLVQDTTARVEMMSKEITSFPTETQVLKLERRVEQLKDQLADSEKQKQQHRTGIDAYVTRQADCARSHEVVSRELQETLSALESAIVDAEVQADKNVVDAAAAHEAADTMQAITSAREDELCEINRQLAAAEEEERALTASILSLQARLEREPPLIDAKADATIARIKEAWQREKAALEAAHKKLFVVNREQNYHLTRGTHVKKVASPVAAGAATSHEEALSAHQARLAAQLLDNAARLAELTDDNKHQKRIIEKLKKEGKEAALAFEAAQRDVQHRLGVARSEHAKAIEEATTFRALKSELQQVLQNVREAPSPKLARS